MKKRIWGIVIAAIILIIGGILYPVLINLKEEIVLKKELEQLLELDITVDSYNTSIKTSGSYAVVEGAIKSYFNDYASDVQKVVDILERDCFIESVTVENFINDGKEFINTKQEFEDVREETNEMIDFISDYSTEEKILSYIEDKELDEYYVRLYRKIMIEGINQTYFESVENDLNQARDMINELIEKEVAIFNFLTDNQDSWYIKDYMLFFTEEALLEEYDRMVSLLNS